MSDGVAKHSIRKPPRLDHRKSKTGCLRCKTRKVRVCAGFSDDSCRLTTCKLHGPEIEADIDICGSATRLYVNPIENSSDTKTSFANGPHLASAAVRDMEYPASTVLNWVIRSMSAHLPLTPRARRDSTALPILVSNPLVPCQNLLRDDFWSFVCCITM